jgi:hypothetical protein
MISIPRGFHRTAIMRTKPLVSSYKFDGFRSYAQGDGQG